MSKYHQVTTLIMSDITVYNSQSSHSENALRISSFNEAFIAPTQFHATAGLLNILTNQNSLIIPSS